MRKTSRKRQPATIAQRFASLETLVRTGFRKTESRFNLVHVEFRSLRKEMNERFIAVDDRIDRLASHVDGFMKLHETMDIEMRVMKEQMNPFEQRLERLESAQSS